MGVMPKRPEAERRERAKESRRRWRERNPETRAYSSSRATSWADTLTLSFMGEYYPSSIRRATTHALVERNESVVQTTF